MASLPPSHFFHYQLPPSHNTGKLGTYQPASRTPSLPPSLLPLTTTHHLTHGIIKLVERAWSHLQYPMPCIHFIRPHNAKSMHPRAPRFDSLVCLSVSQLSATLPIMHPSTQIHPLPRIHPSAYTTHFTAPLGKAIFPYIAQAIPIH